MAKALVDFGKYAEAIESLNMATEKQKKVTYLWNLMGYAFERLGKNDQALDSYNKSLDIDPVDEYATNAKLRIAEQNSSRKEI